MGDCGAIVEMMLSIYSNMHYSIEVDEGTGFERDASMYGCMDEVNQKS